jgi:hypothetical protein
MYRKDLITAEIEKLAQVLAKIIGLKVELKLDDAAQLFQETMQNSFGMPDALLQEQTAAFSKWLEERDLNAEKLNALGEFLYYELGVNDSKNRLIAPKLNLVYEMLSNKYKMVHLVNMHRQQTIQQYL